MVFVEKCNSFQDSYQCRETKEGLLKFPGIAPYLGKIRLVSHVLTAEGMNRSVHLLADVRKKAYIPDKFYSVLTSTFN